MRKLLVLLVILGASHSVFAEDPVFFADANLKAAVEAELGISDPTPTDMLGLTVLNAKFSSIVDLTGIESAINLTSLGLYRNNISNVSSLTGLTNLTSLILSSNQISDISSLAGLKNLTSLIIHNNHINDISILAGLKNLTDLNLGSNQISDISSLVDLTNLTWLQLLNNPLNCPSYDIYIPQIEANNPGIALQYSQRPDDCDDQPDRERL